MTRERGGNVKFGDRGRAVPDVGGVGGGKRAHLGEDGLFQVQDPLFGREHLAL